MTTKEAFEQLIHKRKWYEAAGISESAAWTIASRFKKGGEVSLEKIEALLTAAGFKVVQDKLWQAAGK